MNYSTLIHKKNGGFKMRPLLNYLINLAVFALPSSRFFPLKRLLWRACGVKLGQRVSINSSARLFGDGLMSIGADTWVGIGCSFIVPHGGSVRIGACCDIAPDVLFECGSHKIGSPRRRAGKGYSAPIIVGDGCWIGARVVLLGGAEVGPGSVIAAGAVVRAGLYPAQSLLAGVPARIVRQLHEENILAENDKA